jgi:hypothetical protein
MRRRRSLRGERGEGGRGGGRREKKFWSTAKGWLGLMGKGEGLDSRASCEIPLMR